MRGNNALKILMVALVLAGVVAVASLKSSCCGTTQAAPPGRQTQTDQARAGQTCETPVPRVGPSNAESAESSSAGRVSAPAAKPGVPRLLDLGSGTCIPCKMMVPVLDALRSEYGGKLAVEFIDVWKDQASGERYKVDVIPTQILFDAGGKELGRHVGYWPKEEILAQFAAYGVKLEAGQAEGAGR